MKISEQYQKERENNPIFKSETTVSRMMIDLETRLFEYVGKHNTATPEEYKKVHLPEIIRQTGIITGLEKAFSEHSKPC